MNVKRLDVTPEQLALEIPVFSALFVKLRRLLKLKLDQGEIIQAPVEAPAPPPLSDDQMIAMVNDISTLALLGIEGVAFALAADRPERKRLGVHVHGRILAHIVINFAGQTAHLKSINVAEEFRENGLCRQFIQNLYRALQRHGFSKIDLTASFDGRFVWAALGFHPVLGSWKNLQPRLVRQFEVHGDEYSAETRRLIAVLIARNDPKSLPILANGEGNIEDLTSPRGIAYSITQSTVTWDGEITIGDQVDEQNLFG